MGIIGWIVLGALAGWIASMVTGTREGWVANIIVGIIGGLLGGFIFRSLGLHGVHGFNLWSLLVAVLGAIVLLLILHAFRHGPARTHV